MKLSYEGIGQMCATFACEATMTEGAPVKLTESGKAEVCAAGENLCGVCAAVGHGGDACSVQVGGFVKLSYSGSAPTVGFGKLTADGACGVKTASSGREYLIAQVDPAEKTVTIML